MRGSFQRFATFTNIHFCGIHPDITYLGGRGLRIKSPLGDYHSKIVLSSYLNNLSPEECERRFCCDKYSEYGYYDEYDKSSNELTKRDEAIDIRFSETLIDIIKNRYSLYSINHPVGSVFSLLSDHILSHLGLEQMQFPNGMGFDSLSESQWWPIYREIGINAGLNYSTPLTFKRAKADGGGAIDLTKFIAESFDCYRINDNLVRESITGSSWFQKTTKGGATN